MGLCSKKCVTNVRLDGKTAIVTGSNTGIGKVTVQEFYQRGARVIMACRNLEKAQQAADDIKKSCEGKENLGEIITVEFDLMSLNSVRKCAKHLLETESRIDILVNNAGVMACPEGKTEDGFEIQFGTNHLGHFLFTLLLLPKIIESTPARIVNVSSYLHEWGTIHFEDLNYETRSYSANGAYNQSKLCNVLFTKELATRLNEANITGVNTYALHPGAINTELARHAKESTFKSFLFDYVMNPFFKTPEEGAQTSIYCAIHEDCENETGLYYSECSKTTPSKKARNPETAKRLWEESIKLVGLENYNPFEK